MPLDDDDLFDFDAKEVKSRSKLESSIEAYAVEYAKKRGWMHRKMGTGAWPDHAFLRNGQIVFIEFKQYGKRPRPNQAKRLQELIDQGFIAEVIDTKSGIHDVLL